MFCPQCSQQQVSDDVRFCSRCGLPLEGVATLLANAGLPPPAPAAGATTLGPASPRLKGVRQGITLFLLGMLIVPLLIVLVEEKVLPEGFAFAAAIMLFLGSFVRIAYAFLIEDGPLRRQRLPASAAAHAAAHALPGAPARPSALPPAPRVSAEAYVPPRADTAEIARRPPSVTEGTTRLLDKEER